MAGWVTLCANRLKHAIGNYGFLVINSGADTLDSLRTRHVDELNSRRRWRRPP